MSAPGTLSESKEHNFLTTGDKFPKKKFILVDTHKEDSKGEEGFELPSSFVGFFLPGPTRNTGIESEEGWASYPGAPGCSAQTDDIMKNEKELIVAGYPPYILTTMTPEQIIKMGQAKPPFQACFISITEAEASECGFKLFTKEGWKKKYLERQTMIVTDGVIQENDAIDVSKCTTSAASAEQAKSLVDKALQKILLVAVTNNTEPSITSSSTSYALRLS